MRGDIPGLSSLMTTALMRGSLAAVMSSLHITELAISCTQQMHSTAGERPWPSVIEAQLVLTCIRSAQRPANSCVTWS